MHTKLGPFYKLCAVSVQSGGGPGTPRDFLVFDTAAWFNGGDPAAGVRTVWTCRLTMNCYDTVSGLTYWTGHFSITRTPGPGVGGLLYYVDSTTGLTVSIVVVGTVFKLQVAESVTHLTLTDGLVKYEAHW